MESPNQASKLGQKAVTGVLWSAIESWGRQLISFSVFFLLARLLSPETFGLVSLSGVFLAFLQIFLDQGFSKAIVQRQNLEPEHLDTAFWTNLGVSILLAVISFFSASLFGDLFKEPRVASIIRFLCLGFILSAFSSVQDAILQRKLAFKTLATRSLIAVVIGGIVGLTMAFLGWGVWSLVGQQLSNSLTQVLVLWRTSDWRPKLRFSQKHFKELFTFGINVIGMNLFTFFSRRSDDFLIGYFLGSSALGYYAVAYRVFSLMTELFTSIIVKVSLPTFARLQQEPERLRNTLYQAIQLTSLITFPGFLGMVVLAPEIVRFVFGEKWLPSVPVIQVLSFMGILYAYFYYNGSVLMAVGKPSLKLAIDFMQGISSIISFFIAVQWGIVAVASAFVIRGYLLAPIVIWLVQKQININVVNYLRQAAVPLGGTITMLIAILVIKSFMNSLLSSSILLIVSILIGCIVYILSIFLIDSKLFGRVASIATSLYSK